MRQETGNNFDEQDYGVEYEEFHSIAPAAIEQQELSIQITLNGFSFVVMGSESGIVVYDSGVIEFNSDVDEIRNYDPYLWYDYSRVMIGFSSDHTLLVPTKVFEPESADLYLAAANMINPGECSTLINNTLCDTLTPYLADNERCVAVWQADKSLVTQLIAAYPYAYIYNTLQAYLPAVCATYSIVISLENHTSNSNGNTANIVVRESVMSAAETVIFHTHEELLYYTRHMIKQDGFTGYKVYIIGSGSELIAPLFAQFFASVESVDEPYYLHQKVHRI